MLPALTSAMMSALRTVDRRCATMMLVRPTMIMSSAVCRGCGASGGSGRTNAERSLQRVWGIGRLRSNQCGETSRQQRCRESACIVT
eukprot:313264-Chlamydomonas_euryale.AAC.5